MKDGNVIEVNNVYKKFKKYFDKSSSLKEKVLHRERTKYQDYWVLKGICFEVAKGEAVGLVGCNGCGKSTTLKLLTKIIYPDEGNIEMKGKVSSLLELGAGFHPDLSGYENIYLNAAVFGLTRKQIDKRVDEIVHFSELEEFIKNPIRTYSSGMYMKLAFSVAINVDADILLIDEILGVGDVNFQKKCFEKLLSIKKNGTTIVIVSHSMDQIEKICDRSIWLEQGKIREEGTPKEVHAKYMDKMNEKRLEQQKKDEEYKKAEEYKRAEEYKKAEELKKQKIRIQEERKAKLQNQQRQRERKKAKLLEEAQEEKKHQEELIAQIEKEKQNQLKAQQEAEERRKQLEELQEEVIRKKNQSDKAAYFQSEKARLEVVVQEKNMELERLNSVIREKAAEIGRIESLLKEKENQLNQIVLGKDAEIERLEAVIQEKENQLNQIVLGKDAEIERLEAVIREKESENETLREQQVI